MRLFCDETVTTVVTMEHMVKNDFFLRLIEIIPEPGEVLTELSFRLYAGQELCCERSYDRTQVESKLEYARQELARYRPASMMRILGRQTVPDYAVMHEYFSLFTPKQVDVCEIVLKSNLTVQQKRVALREYKSENTYVFPMKGIYLVSDTYPSINSHRWCRNSEFAMDIGAFSEDLSRNITGGREVYAACGGTVEEVFDGLPDSCDDTDFDQIQCRYGEHARIDGNHVLIRHNGGELTLYSHLQRGSVLVRPGDRVEPLTPIGKSGSSGSSMAPHLHFHAMLEGIHGPGIPVAFSNLVSFFGEPCPLDEPTNLVRTL